MSLKVAMLLSTAFLDYKNYMVVPFLDLDIPITKRGQSYQADFLLTYQECDDKEVNEKEVNEKEKEEEEKEEGADEPSVMRAKL